MSSTLNTNTTAPDNYIKWLFKNGSTKTTKNKCQNLSVSCQDYEIAKIHKLNATLHVKTKTISYHLLQKILQNNKFY